MHPFDGRVVSTFIRQALANESITLFGDGQQTRSFCFRDDLVSGLISMMNHADHCVGPINLGNPHECSVGELAEKIIALTGASSKIEHCELPQDDPLRRQPDITKAREILSWEPVTDLDDGLNQTIEWFRSIDLRHYRPPTPNYT